MYNDLREAGRFADRSTLLVNVAGSRDAWATSPDRQNYLGLKGARILFYEVDATTPPHQGCAATEYVGATQADDDGVWSWTGTVCDMCRVDGEGAQDNGVSVAVRVALDHCATPGEGCVSVDDPGTAGLTDHYADAWSGTTWSRWWRGADTSSPRRIFNGTPVSVGVDYFQATAPSAPMVVTDLAAQAANVFASLIDVTQRVHVSEGVPFDQATWGKIHAYFPSPIGGSAHSHQAGRLCIAAPQWRDDADPSLYQARNPQTWVGGDEAVHEYGHLLHYWRWDGFGKWQSFCFDSDGDGWIDQVDAQGRDIDFGLTGDGDGADECAESSEQREHPGAAFKEGWANFIRRVTFDGANVGLSCGSMNGRTSRASTFALGDGTPVCPVAGVPCEAGKHFAGDVEHALCEIWDGDLDDTLHASLSDMLDAVANMWDVADVSVQADLEAADSFGPGRTAIVPMGLCKFTGRLRRHVGVAQADIDSALAVAGVVCDP
ncbi:MAG: hypothetical protein R3B06_12435 [Kofleriaceae bacterium]